jgi:lysozyme family protein
MSFWQSLARLFARAPAPVVSRETGNGDTQSGLGRTGDTQAAIPVVAVGDGHIGQSERFGVCLAHVLRHEGGYVDHARDPGGATNMGITIGTLSDWLGRPATKAEVRALPKDIAAAIYHKNYWLPVRGDALGPGLDLAVMDFAVNSGPGRAVRTLQAALGVQMDGAMGPVTLGALAGRDRVALVQDICDRRMAFLRSLDTFDAFGRGWSRRVAEVEDAALSVMV